MREQEHVVVAVIDAAGGKLTGRVRLQKTVYLLDQLGMNSGFSFDYHHYGPYSRELDNATADAKAFKLIVETFHQRQIDGASFSMFQLNGTAKSGQFGKLGAKKAKELVAQLADASVTVLELAATIDWLWRYEKIADWQTEIRKRKGVKVQNGRLEKAVELLTALSLAPPTPQQA